MTKMLVINKAMAKKMPQRDEVFEYFGIANQKGWKQRLVGRKVEQSWWHDLVFGPKRKKPKRSKPKKRKRKTKKVTYATYIASNAWKRKRKEAFEFYGQKCDECGTEGAMEVHHKTYARLGDELMEDLQILCCDCHTLKHPDCEARKPKDGR